MSKSVQNLQDAFERITELEAGLREKDYEIAGERALRMDVEEKYHALFQASEDEAGKLQAEITRLWAVVDAARGIRPYLPDLDSAPRTTKVEHIERTRALDEALAALDNN